MQRAPGFPCALCPRRRQADAQLGCNGAARTRRRASLAPRNISALAKAALTGQKNRWGQETPAENDLTIKGKAYIAGIYEHPTRHAPDKSTAQLHAEVAKGAIEHLPAAIASAAWPRWIR